MVFELAAGLSGLSVAVTDYPVIADLDADGHAEIIVANEGNSGITAYRDSNNSWAPARDVWNQHAYTITNINDDLSVPASPTPNWASWNNFRAGGTITGPSSWLPNLEPAGLETCADTCDDGVAVVWAGVANTGLIAAAGVSLKFTDRSAFASVSIMYWYRIGALTSGGAAVKRARPPKIMCFASGEGR